MQYADFVRNAGLDARESAVGTDAVLKIFDGAIPANCAAADAGTVLSTINLPTDWMADAAGGAKASSGSWQDLAADASGTAAYFRLYKSDGTTCGWQGTCGLAGADMILDSTNFTAGQKFTVTSFTIQDNNG
ncbi:MAG: hypothetical protein GC182_08885 [Rhodopseudomonas sp.]|nr:hypothetical protein [Rhodopseudomonas sp.]